MIPSKVPFCFNKLLPNGKTISYHFLQEHWKPVEIKRKTCQITPTSAYSLLDEVEAKIHYQHYYTGTFTENHSFGSDPMHDNDDLRNRSGQSFFQRYHIESIF